GLVDDAAEQIEVEHAGLARARDAGLRRAAGFGAGDVAGGRALDVHPRRQRAGVDWPHRRRPLLPERQLQRTVAAEPRPAAVQVGPQPRHDVAAPPLADRGGARVAEHALAVGIRAAADDAAVAEHHERAPRPAALKAGGEVIEGHVGAARYYAVRR